MIAEIAGNLDQSIERYHQVGNLAPLVLHCWVFNVVPSGFGAFASGCRDHSAVGIGSVSTGSVSQVRSTSVSCDIFRSSTNLNLTCKEKLAICKANIPKS